MAAEAALHDIALGQLTRQLPDFGRSGSRAQASRESMRHRGAALGIASTGTFWLDRAPSLVLQAGGPPRVPLLALPRVVAVQAPWLGAQVKDSTGDWGQHLLCPRGHWGASQ